MSEVIMRTREHRGRVVQTVLWRIVLGCVALSACACSPQQEVLEAHAEIARLRERIRPGMTPEEIRAEFERQNPRRLRFVYRDDTPVVLIQQVVQESAAKEWLLWVSLGSGTAAAVRIRTNDSPLERPPAAPEDLLWATEDAGTPFTAGRVP